MRFNNPLFKFKIVLVAGVFMPLGSASADPVKGDPERGGEVAKKCARCHGDSGIKEDDPEMPIIAGQLASYTYKQLRDFASGARDNARVRRALRKTTEQEMADVAAYLASLPNPAASGGAPLPTPAVVTKGDPGREIPACAACHGAQGEGNAGAVVPAMAGQKRGYLVKTMKDFRSDERANDAGGAIRAIIKKLSEQDIAQIADYYASLPPAANQ